MKYEMSTEETTAAIIIMARTVGMQNFMIEYAKKDVIDKDIYMMSYNTMTGFALFMEIITTQGDLTLNNISMLKNISDELAKDTPVLLHFLVEQTKIESKISANELTYMLSLELALMGFFMVFENWYNEIALPIIKGQLAIPEGTDSIVQ